MTARWSDYVLALGGDVETTWKEAAQRGDTAWILGEGFDPRALLGLQEMIDARLSDAPSVLSVRLGEPESESDTGELARENIARLEDLDRSDVIQLSRLPMPEVEERRSEGRHITHYVLEHEAFKTAQHVVVDISALPAGVYFPLISGILRATEHGLWDGELQVVVAENPQLDTAIIGEGVSSPNPIAGFKFAFDVEGQPEGPRVWAPVLGENAGAELDAIRIRLEPDEVCPILPFPARNPRRADDLLLEHRELLVDQLRVEPANYIYANEANPFDLYRALSQLKARYRRALRPLGQAMVIVSTHASKMLSIGALLAAHEFEMPVINAASERYILQSELPIADNAGSSRLACLWLAGEPTR